MNKSYHLIVTTFPAFFVRITSTFEFLPQVESYVHLEVRKLYPEVEKAVNYQTVNQKITFKIYQADGGEFYFQKTSVPDLQSDFTNSFRKVFGSE